MSSSYQEVELPLDFADARWDGAAALSRAFTTDSGQYYLRHVRLYRTGFLEFFLAATETEAPIDFGPDFVPAIETGDDVFAFRYVASDGAVSNLVIDGPDNPANTLRSEEEPYSFTPDNRTEVADFRQAVEDDGGAGMLTLAINGGGLVEASGDAQAIQWGFALADVEGGAITLRDNADAEPIQWGFALSEPTGAAMHAADAEAIQWGFALSDPVGVGSFCGRRAGDPMGLRALGTDRRGDFRGDR